MGRPSEVRFSVSCLYRADVLRDEAISDLFEHEKDPIMIIKQKELYEESENVADYCEHTANVVESILVKNN